MIVVTTLTVKNIHKVDVKMGSYTKLFTDKILFYSFRGCRKADCRADETDKKFVVHTRREMSEEK